MQELFIIYVDEEITATIQSEGEIVQNVIQEVVGDRWSEIKSALDTMSAPTNPKCFAPS